VEGRVPGLRLDTPVRFLKGIGERRAEAMARLGIETAGDLLFHLPHRYIDASSVTPVAHARVGDDVACVGTVVTKAVTPTRKGLRIFSAVIRDDSGVLECVWPGQPFLDRTIQKGQTLLVAGPVRFYHGRQMAPREYVVLDEGDGAEPFDAGRVLPVYPATEGLSHKILRGLIDRQLDDLLPLVIDSLPDSERRAANVVPLADALRMVHRPASAAEAEQGRQRLAFDELLDLQLTLGRARRLARREREGGFAFALARTLTSELRASLPYELTAGQRAAIADIVADMTSGRRMHRLLMGDVGTGKTVVALFGMLLALENDRQAALMAPTELLAEQHHATLTTLLEPLGIVPELLLGRLRPSAKSATRERLATGKARIVIGTHALIQDDVAFRRLGLVVIDEQHRFGVEQRAALIGKGAAPDVLLLSATPIPRSLALTRFGDLDISLLRERPPGRGRVRTAVRRPGQRAQVFDFVARECRAGRQAYVVLPVIEASERADLRAARDMAAQLAERWPDLEIGLVHGKLKADERDAVMRRFRAGEVGVLVATTVIEVGIDVANATIMVIDHPERFGLAQLHQLRGRVGRGGEESYCILLSSEQSSARLHAFAATEDGFRIAELDLNERGLGDLIGTRQSGGYAVRFARLPDDEALLDLAGGRADAILDGDPALRKPAHRVFRDRIMARYPRAAEFFRTG
jgi:ATP-dependent DNA helicase RecG